MSKYLVAVLLFASAVFAQSTSTSLVPDTQGRISVTPIPEGDSLTTFAVTIERPDQSEEVTATVCYWVHVNGITSALVHCVDSIIPAIEHGAAAVPEVPVGIKDIYSVRVKIVRVVEGHSFFQQAKP